MIRIRTLAAAALVAAVTALPAGAQQIFDVDGTYVSTTNQIAIDPMLNEGDPFTSVSFAGFSITSSTVMLKEQIGSGWASWSVGNPNSEWDGSSPYYIGWVQGPTTTFTMSAPVSIFGIEAEPDTFAPFDFTVDYFSGATLVGSISRTIDGSGGARLLGFEYAGGFDRAVVTTNDTDFAVAQFRVQLAPTTATPEPATMALMATGLGLVGMVARRRRNNA